MRRGHENDYAECIAIENKFILAYIQNTLSLKSTQPIRKKVVKLERVVIKI